MEFSRNTSDLAFSDTVLKHIQRWASKSKKQKSYSKFHKKNLQIWNLVDDTTSDSEVRSRWRWAVQHDIHRYHSTHTDAKLCVVDSEKKIPKIEVSIQARKEKGIRCLTATGNRGAVARNSTNIMYKVAKGHPGQIFWIRFKIGQLYQVNSENNKEAFF